MVNRNFDEQGINFGFDSSSARRDLAQLNKEFTGLNSSINQNTNNIFRAGAAIGGFSLLSGLLSNSFVQTAVSAGKGTESLFRFEEQAFLAKVAIGELILQFADDAIEGATGRLEGLTGAIEALTETKGLTYPDGTPVLDEEGQPIQTQSTAQRIGSDVNNAFQAALDAARGPVGVLPSTEALQGLGTIYDLYNRLSTANFFGEEKYPPAATFAPQPGINFSPLSQATPQEVSPFDERYYHNDAFYFGGVPEEEFTRYRGAGSPSGPTGSVVINNYIQGSILAESNLNEINSASRVQARRTGIE